MSNNDFRPPTEEELEAVNRLKEKLATEHPNLDYTFTDTAVLRFLRGRKHDEEKALKALVRHVQWRKENDVENITEESIPNEFPAQKLFVSGTDFGGRPLLFIMVRNHHKDHRDIDEMKRFIIFNLEQAIRRSNPSEERITIVFDMTGFGFQCMDYEVVKVIIDILSYNYPEILFRGLIVASPFIFSGCWLVIRPWLDPVTAAKVEFASKAQLTNYMDAKEIPPIVLSK